MVATPLIRFRFIRVLLEMNNFLEEAGIEILWVGFHQPEKIKNKIRDGPLLLVGPKASASSDL